MKLSGHTQPFAVLGHPIGHTLSPAMHNAAFAALGMDAIYLAFDVHPGRLMSTLPAMADMGFRGVNLTVPLKEVAFGGLRDLDISARRLGAVNTVEFLPGGMRGHNTDGYGFLQALNEAFGLRLDGRAVAILGCGGAGRAVAITCAAEGAASLALTDMDPRRPARVRDEIRSIAANTVVAIHASFAEFERAAARADLVVQATPVGMQPGEASLFPPAAFRRDLLAFDLVYNIPETPFMRAAKEGGARAVNGLGMLLHQGAAAFKIWTGREPAVPAMRQALEQSLYAGA